MEHIKNTVLITQEELTQNLSKYITTKDYSLTKETFNLRYNQKLDLLITDPIPNNLDKYYEFDSYISHTDSKKSIIDKVYQIVRNYTLEKKLKLINSYQTSEKRILDIGCGTGDFLLKCKNNNWETTGVEPNEKAKTKAIEKGLFIENNLNSITGSFDVITLWHVLEHVPNLLEYTKQLEQLLDKDGVLIIAVPNYKSYDANYYKEFWAAFDVPRHLWHFSKNSIERLFSYQNMKVEKVLPMLFDSFYVALLSEKYKNGYINPINAFYRGLLSNIKAKRTKQHSSHIYILKKSI